MAVTRAPPTPAPDPDGADAVQTRPGGAGHGDAAAILGLLALVLVFNPGLAFQGLVLGGYDTFVYFYPLRAYLAEALAEGRLPLWNPRLFLGVPFLANPQAAVFYPPTWLFAVVDVPYAYGANFLGHVFLAGATLYAFAHWSLGLGRIGSFLGGCAFAFSGFMAGQAGHINQVSVAAWLPAVALALDGALRGRGRLAVAALVVGLVLQLLAGHPQEVYMTLVVLGLIVLWRCWSGGYRAIGRGLAVLGLAAALAFGIAAIQLLPTAELARLSIRGGGLDYEQAIVGSLPWQLLLPALLPGFWAHLHTTELFGHTGVIVLVLAWLGLLLGPARPVALGALLVVVGLGLAVGNANPLYRPLFDWAPGFGSFRVPARWLFVYTFGVALLVAVGTSWLVERTRRGSRGVDDVGAVRLVVGLGVPLVALGLIVFGQRQSRLLLLTWTGLAAVGLLLALATVYLRRARTIPLGLLVVGSLVELWWANADLEHRHPIPNLAYRQPRESTELLRSLDGVGGPFRMLSLGTAEYEVKESPDYRREYAWLHPEALKNLLVAVKWNEALLPNVPLQYGLNSADGYDGGVLPLADFVKLTGAMLGWDRVRPDGVLASRLDHLPERRWLDLLGVRYAVAARIKDVTNDGLYYDRALTATLRPGERIELTSLPLGEFTRLGMISSYRGQSGPGGEVGRLELGAAEREMTVVPLLDGTHTGAADARATGLPNLERIQEWGADDPGGPGDWIAQVRFARRPVGRLAIVNTSPDLVLEVRSLNLVDDVRQASFSLTLGHNVDRTEFFDMKVYDRRDALARAYVPRAAVVLDDEAAARRLGEPDFDPREQVVLAPMDGAQPVAATDPTRGAAQLELDEPERVRIRVRREAPGYVVLSDSWYPGWRATVDGQAAPIVRANLLFRAVPVPAGEHVVELGYEPASLRIGAAISAGSLVAATLLWWVASRRWPVASRRRAG